MGTYKRKGTVTISIDELERLQSMDNLTHKQRFTIDRLKRDLNAMTVKASNFSKKTFELLKSLGFTDKAIFEYYKEKPKKRGGRGLMRSKRSKATDISYKTKYEVWERDNHRCIFCGSSQAMPNAHYIPRSKGGLGVVQNIVTACNECHFKMDNSKYRKEYLTKTREYLKNHYPGWYENDLIYAKK